MYEHRYICTNCTMGWHNTPYCPFPVQTVTITRPLTDFELSKLARLDELEKAGVISKRNAQLFRGWWILPVALALFFAILLIT